MDTSKFGLPTVVDFGEVDTIPAFSTVITRDNCDSSVVFGGRTFRTPVIPSNMRTVLDEPLALTFAREGHFYVMHRFDINPVRFTERAHEAGQFASISLGVKREDYEAVDQLAASALMPEYITVDIAHGHSVLMRDMLAHIKTKLPSSFVIAGNIGTPEAVADLESWGADATKIGIGPGLVCITRDKTGAGTGGWQLGAVRWCAQAATKSIIADGGIRNHGHIGHAVGYGGADMVMFGSLLAAHRESPGNLVEINGQRFKEYFGSASEYNRPGRKPKNVEGKRTLIPYKDRSVLDLMVEIEEDLHSAISYAGGLLLHDLRRARYINLKSCQIESGLVR